MVIRASEVNAKTLEYIYDVCNRLIKGDCFYTKEDLEQEKTNEKNIFLKKSQGVKNLC